MIPVWCPAIWLNSDILILRGHQVPQSRGQLHPHTSDASESSYRGKALVISSLHWINWLIGLQDSGKYISIVTILLKDMIKDTDEESNEKIQKIRSGSIPVQEFYPFMFGNIIHFTSICLPRLEENFAIGILQRSSHINIYKLHFQSFSPSLKK